MKNFRKKIVVAITLFAVMFAVMFAPWQTHMFDALGARFGVPLAQADFSDVGSTNPHYVAINSLVDQGILEGYEDGTFLPDQEVNRAEALKIILLGMGVEVDEGSIAGALFSDVNEDDWYFPYVGTAVSAGIVDGYDDGTFLPGQTVNRAEAMKMLLLANGLEPDAASENPFVDVDKGAWFSAYANFARRWNIEPPQVDGRWHPEEDVTRANLSEMVYRLQQVDSSGTAFVESTNWLRKSFPTVDISLLVPFGWNYKQEGVGAVWILDTEHVQLSMLEPYYNGGTLLMTRYANSAGQSANALFANVIQHTDADTERTQIGGYDALVVSDDGHYFKQWYVMMDNGSLIHFAGMDGGGYYSEWLEAYIEMAVESMEYEADASEDLSVSEKVEQLRTAIQVDGAGQDMMELFDDWDLFETDSIGVGTGPVDYYYSPTADITVKYERSYDVILDIEEGQTSAF